MLWEEIDLKRLIWTIPAARMKAASLHRVPLTEEMIALLPKQRDEGLVFRNSKNNMYSDMTLTMMLRRMNGKKLLWKDEETGECITPHGFRSTFRVWTGEQTSYPRELSEAALAHAIESEVEATYQRSDLLEKRRSMMVDWCRYVTGSTANRRLVET